MIYLCGNVSKAIGPIRRRNPPLLFLERPSINLTHARNIRCSNPLNALPPIAALAIRPILKLTAMLFGRHLRKQWQKLPPDKRVAILKYFKSRRSHITAGFVILGGFGFLYYIEHIEVDPITQRKRFILYKDDQMSSIADLQFESSIAEYKKEIIPSSHPIYGRVVRVANKLLQANKSLPQIQGKNWAVTVIDRPDITNAFVLPNGKIFVFTGILNVASNDNQLAVVLSHEIAHCLLQHVSENLSKMLYVDIVLLIPLVVMWTILPDAAALFSQWLTSRLAEVIIHLPFSRAIESEADVVGLELAARACYDVREAPVFWGKMDEVIETFLAIL